MFVTVCQQRTSTVPKNRGTCGIAVLKSTVKATVLVPLKNGTAVVPWYRATLMYTTLPFWILWHQTMCRWCASQAIQHMHCSQPMCRYSSPWRLIGLLRVWHSTDRMVAGNLERQTFSAFSPHRGKMQQQLQMHKVDLGAQVCFLLTSVQFQRKYHKLI